MDEKRQEELALLYARVDDLEGRARRGEVAISPFLSPADARAAAEHARRMGASAVAFGGYGGAERVRLYLLPDYLGEVGDEALEETLSSFGLESEITALHLRGSGFCRLSHRDYLGALLGLGIARSVLGDLVTLGEEGTEAVLLCDTAMADFLLSTPLRVGRDTVRPRRLERQELLALPLEKRTIPVSDTVASPRLDCVVAALCGLSREKARDAVLGGLVSLEHEIEERPDRAVTAPAVLSVRGFGRYRILSLSDQTRKGRFRLGAEKYV